MTGWTQVNRVEVELKTEMDHCGGRGERTGGGMEGTGKQRRGENENMQRERE